MAGPNIKKRHVPGVSTGTTEAPATRPMAQVRRTVTWYKTSEWQRDNKYILSGYRPENADYLHILKSMTFLHNETCNIYTHLAGALLLPFFATGFIQILSEPQFLNVSLMDYIMFGAFLCCAECCLIFSVMYHLLGCHSHSVEQFWHQTDMLGIVLVTMGTFVPGIYYIYGCDPGLQNLHSAIVSHSKQSFTLPVIGTGSRNKLT